VSVRGELFAVRVGRLVETIFVFFLIGPPLGAVVIALIGWIGAPPTRTGTELLSVYAVGTVSWLIPLSYFFGTIPALMSGTIVGATRAVLGRVPRWMVLAAGFGSAFADLYLGVGVVGRLGNQPVGDWNWFAMAVLAALLYVVPTVICVSIERFVWCALTWPLSDRAAQ
jgi:hypothetical protein